MGQNTFSWTSTKGLNIFAQEWKPAGEIRAAVALVHGLGDHSGRYQHVAQALNAAGYALVGLDLPGHGQSGGTRGHSSYDAIAEEIDHLLRETAQRYPGKPVFLYGHSMGGALALYYSLKKHPELRGVIATSPGLATGDPVPAPKLTLARIMARLMPSFTMENGLDLANLTRDPAIIDIYKADPLVHPRISAQLALDLLTKGEWMLAHAAEFPLPLLLVQGSGDHLVSPKATAAFAKAAPADKLTYKVWEGFYHETHNEPEKQQVIQYMIDWLNAHL